MVKKLCDFASIYLLAYIMYCNLFRENVFAKITHVVFSGLRNTTRLPLQTGRSTCIISDNRRGAL